MSIGQIVRTTERGVTLERRIVGLYPDGKTIIVEDGPGAVTVLRRNLATGGWAQGKMPVELEILEEAA